MFTVRRLISEATGDTGEHLLRLSLLATDKRAIIEQRKMASGAHLRLTDSIYTSANPLQF